MRSAQLSAPAKMRMMGLVRSIVSVATVRIYRRHQFPFEQRPPPSPSKSHASEDDKRKWLKDFGDFDGHEWGFDEYRLSCRYKKAKSADRR